MLLVFITFSSCKKSQEENQPAPVRTTASISFNNGIPELNKLDFYVNGTKKASLSDALNSTYNEIATGKIEVKVINPISGAMVATTTLEILARDYSIFLCGNPIDPILVFSEDNLNAPATDNGKIRFVNLSPAVKNLSINEVGKQALFSNRPYKTSTSFENIPAANEISFNLKETGSDAVITTLEKTKIEKGKIYTLIATGERIENGSNANVKLLLLVNK